MRRASLLVLGLLASSAGAEPADLTRLRDSLERIQVRLESGVDPQALSTELEAIRSAYERRAGRLEAAIERAEKAVSDLGLGAVAAERVARARQAFEASERTLLAHLTKLAETLDLAELEACLSILDPVADAERADLLSAQELPLRGPELRPPPLSLGGPTTTAAFSEGAEGAAEADPIGAVPAEIQDLAAGLEGAVAAYELVKNQTRFELYFGSMKGSVQTLREGSGNDADTARLLVDLLRAEGIPARYVRGVVRLRMDQAKSWIGTDLPERVEEALASAAVPYEPRFAGGAVAAIEKEHVWVEAYVPWSNYRGVAVDSRGRRWVPLDASFKMHDVDPGHPVLEEMAFDAESFVLSAFEAPPQTDPREALRSRVADFLSANAPGVDFEGALRKVVPRAEVFGLLPASLPYEVVSIRSVSFDFPEELEHRIRFVARRRDGEVILDSRFPVPRLIGRRLTLSYTPAEQEDRETAASFGSLYRTPPFLIHVRPVVRSAGLVAATGGAIEMGGPFELETELIGPAGSVVVSNRMIAGAYAALALSGRTPGYEERAESQAGEILNQRALDYLARWNEIDRELAGLTRVLTFRPIPSHVLVRNAVAVEYAADGSLVPLTFEWKGIQVDADLRPVAAVPAEAAGESRRDFYLLSGLMGSELEGRILEEGLGVNAVSTVEVLRLASSRGVAVRAIDRANADFELALIDLEPELEDSIASHAHRGRIARAPVTELSLLAWSGGGFTAWDPETGESAYMLSGRIAGASSADDPDDIAAALADALKDPTEPVSEPSQIVGAIEKVDSTDFQEAIVGRELLLALEVEVTDAEGEPIADGVPVTFRAVDEGSLLASEDLTEQGSVIQVPTFQGRARARLRLGTSTRNDPRFLRENPEDEFLTQVGLYRVSVEAGDVEMAQPFSAFALPDDEKDSFGRHGRLAYVSGAYARTLPLIDGAVPLWVEVVDGHGNPLSNMNVNWDVLEAERLPGIPEPLPAVFENAKIEGEEGDLLESDQRQTSSLGSLIFARLGDVDATRYKVAATTTDSKYPGGPIEFVRDSADLRSGRTKLAIGEILAVVYVENGILLKKSAIVLEEGGRTTTTQALSMGPAGGLLPERISFEVAAYQESHEAVLNAQGKWELQGRGRFTRRDVTDASVTPTLLAGDGVFEPRSLSQANAADGVGYAFLFAFGKTPGLRRYGYAVEAPLERPVVNPETGDISIHSFTARQGSQDDGRMIFGVSARLLPQSPDPFLLDSSGHLAPGSTIGFEILPQVVDEALAGETLGRVLEVYENRELFAFGDLPAASPLTFNTANGYDPENVYQARLVLLPGTTMELSAPATRLQFFHAFLKGSKPRPILVREAPDPNDPAKTKLLTPENSLLEYFIRPTQLPLEEARVELIAVDRASGAEELLADLPGNTLSGDGAGVLAQGFEANVVEKEYKAILRVSPQGRPVLRSEPQPVRFTRVLYDVRDPVRVTFESGASNVCFVPEAIVYGLEVEADVTISVMEIEGNAVVQERVVFQGRVPPSGAASFTIGPQDVSNTAARYAFRIQAAAVEDSTLREEYIGSILLQTDGNVVLPVGRTFVKGVDLSDGHLVASSTDVSIPGRGPALELIRTYGSAGNSDRGVMGAGWAMNTFSTLRISSCSWTVVGGDGSGQSFTQVGDRFVPQKGYHTELVRNGDGSFDFFTKGRVRYHYLDVPLFEGERLYGGRPTLRFIEDPNGNRLELSYDGQRNITEVKEVFRGGAEGRSLTFEYAQVFGEPRLTRVLGPMNLEVSYEYDEYGNLVEARRDERVERYEYDTGNQKDRHNLVAYTDPNGNVTRYEYFGEDEPFPGETPDTLAAGGGRFEWVKRVEEPEGATTEFFYDHREINAGFFNTTVTDARRNATRYKLDLNGSPVRIEEPKGVVTTMVWAANDIVKESETDALGRTTLFEYDERGNLKKETIRTSDRGDVVTEFEYHPLFNKMTLKRVQNVDSEGNPVVQETRFLINGANGNLERVTDAEGNQTDYEYLENGDLELVRGPRAGQVTGMTYDELGNPFSTTDAEGNVTTTVYDERSRLTSSEDTLGRRMSQGFDELDRARTITRSDDKGSSDTEVILRDYYPGGQLLRETNGLGLGTSVTLDGLNRAIGTEDDLGNTTVTKYDGNGNVVEKRDRRGVVTLNTYDELNRLTKIIVSGSSGTQVVAEMDYDAVGNKLFETDIHGSRTDFEYDGLYRVTRRLLPTGHTESFRYDHVGNKLFETDANGNETAFAYDRLNRLVGRIDAEGNEVELGYDASGNPTLERDVTRGLTTTTLYDFLNRPESRTIAGEGSNAFSYETRWEYFDSEHRVVETDPRGFRKTAVLDGFDRVHELRQETGSEELVTLSFYDANGNLKRTVDAETRATLYVHDGLNRLKEMTDAAGERMTYEYDGEGNKIQEVSRRGVLTRFVYDHLGRLTSTTMEQPLSGKGVLHTFVVFNDLTRERIEFDARGNQTRFLMDERQRVLRITDPDQKTQSFEYDGVNKVAEVDKRGTRTEFEYDRINRLTRVLDPLGRDITTQYLDSDRQVVETDKRGIQKTTQLDALGRLVSVTRSGVLLERHEYDANNNRAVSMDANGNPTRFEYDGANRLIRRIDADQTGTNFRYDRVGNLLEQKDGRDTGKTFDVRNTYDELNRLKTSEDGEGNVTSYEYDPDGNRTAVIEPKGAAHRTEYDYGEMNELLEVRMPDGGVYKYDYDANRNRTRQTDANDHVVEFTYDTLNRLDRMTQDPLGFRLVTNHDYDPNGNEIKLTDPKGQVIDFEYDELNRLKTKVYNLTAADLALYTRTHKIEYVYDANDNLTRIDETKSSGTDPPAIVSSFKTYDDLDRLETETDAWGRRLTYDYDSQGNRTLLIDPDSVRTEYSYDELNRLETLTFGDGQAVSYEYFPDGLKQRVTNPNGTVSTYEYDDADRMTGITHTGPTGVVSAYEYFYDPNSNRERQVETNAGRTETTEYTYDFVNRLKTVTYPDRTTRYEYDLSGNRIQEITTGADASDKTFEYDAINRLERVTDTATEAEIAVYSYDANGNTTSKTASGVTTNFLFDIRDQLGEVRQGGNILGRYGYDYDGRRILKIGDDGRRQYTYDQLSVVTEADQVNATVSKYDYGMDQLARLDNRGEGRSFFHLDGLRSMVSLTDPEGASRQSIFYDAWGNERDRIGASANNFTFTGHELDEETGLIYAKARFYDAEVGRFLSQDSLLGEANSPPSLHRYFYANQNPLAFFDPNGREAASISLTASRGEVFDPFDGSNPFVYFSSDFNWRAVGSVAFNRAADIGDSVGALGRGVWGAGTGFVGGTYHLLELDQKLRYGGIQDRVEASQEILAIGKGAVTHVAESASYLGRGVLNPGEVLDAMTELGIEGSSEIVGGATFETALLVAPMAKGAPAAAVVKEGQGAAATIAVEESQTAARIVAHTSERNAPQRAAVELALRESQASRMAMTESGGFLRYVAAESRAIAADSGAGQVSTVATRSVTSRTVRGVVSGEAGRFAELDARAVVGDALTPHHMPQAAAKFTSRAEGGAIVIPHAEHVFTRTYGAGGRAVVRQEAGLSFREVFARDIRDLRRIAGAKYNEGLRTLIKYYRENFPDLIKKYPNE